MAMAYDTDVSPFISSLLLLRISNSSVMLECADGMVLSRLYFPNMGSIDAFIFGLKLPCAPKIALKLFVTGAPSKLEILLVNLFENRGLAPLALSFLTTLGTINYGLYLSSKPPSSISV